MAKTTRKVVRIGKSDYEIKVTNDLPNVRFTVKVLGVYESSSIRYSAYLTRNGVLISNYNRVGELGPKQGATKSFNNVVNKGTLKVGFTLTKIKGSSAGSAIGFSVYVP